jgi:PTS system mannose-specific IIC component
MVMSRGLGYATLTMRFSPLMTGLVVGAVMGNIPQAMIITATIQLIYMGVFAPGGAMPSEPCVAAAIAVPVALLAKLSPVESLAIAVPVGLMGGYLYQLRFFINTFIVRLTDKYAEQANDKGLTLSIIVLPILVSFLLYVPIMFIALFYGAPVIGQITASAQGTWFFQILKVIGGGLPVLGIALTMHVIGKREYLPFFFLAYFAAVMFKSLGITMITYAIIGTIIAFLYVIMTNKNKEA